MSYFGSSDKAMAQAKPGILKRLFFFTIYFGILILITIGIDRAIVSRFAERQFNDGLIFNPFTRIISQTIEYKYEVYVNNNGFRDVKNPIAQPVKYRIMAIGDSFTYGWGVEIEQSWPKVLEGILNEQGLNVEVDDLGKPGAGPKEYAEIAEKAIAVLKPDLVIVGILQGDDLAQSRPGPESGVAEQPEKSLRQTLAGLIRRIYPYTASLIAKNFTPVITDAKIHQAWKEQAGQTLARFNPEQKERFNLLDEEVKKIFLSGEFNPAVIYLAITNPDYFLELESLENPKTREHIKEMAKELERIKNDADKYKARVMVVFIPHRIYISEADFNTPRRFGFNLDPQMLTSEAMDQAIADACQRDGLEFLQFTGQFRTASKNTSLFFRLDGHLNPAGHQLLGKMLAPAIADSFK